MYAQTNYSQRLGNGPYTIADAGCFLTAFSNLLARFGEPVDPPTLNTFFIRDNKYTHDPTEAAGTADNLYWGAVSAYDGHIIPVGVGGAGWPDSNDAIVEFRYKGPRTGAIVTHFCLVQNAAAHQIVDSYDGVVKVSPYGTPVAWAKYERHVPVLTASSAPPPAVAPAFALENIDERVEELKVNTHLWDMNQRTWPGIVNNPVGNGPQGTTFKTNQIAHHILGGSYYLPEGSTTQGYNVVDCQPAAAPAPAPAAPAPAPVSSTTPQGAYRLPSGKQYELITKVPGYRSATQAGNHQNPTTTLEAGVYFVFNIYPNRPDLLNLTKKDGTAGSWINTADNVRPEPAPAPAPAPTPPPAKTEGTSGSAENVTIAVNTPPLPHGDWRDSFTPLPKAGHYVSINDVRVDDLSGLQPEMLLPAQTKVSVFGTVKKDDVEYYRLKTNNDPEFKFWYAIPKLDAAKKPLLLALPDTKLRVPGRATLARDTLELAKLKIEHDVPLFLDDIIPKWLRKPKNKK